MISQKNLLGLVFFFFSNSTFSQQKPFVFANDFQYEYAFVETANTDPRIPTNVTTVLSTRKNQTTSKIYDFLSGRSGTIDTTTANFIVEPLSMNSRNSDYAPSFYKGELVFASARNSTVVSKILQKDTNEPFLDLYTTGKTMSDRKISKLKGAINTKFHESSATFSPDEKTIYFTRNNYANRKLTRNKGGYVSLKIYKADYVNGKWKNVEELPFSSDEYSVANPALSPDGTLLYFASDMPGSYGKSDIYVVEIYKDGSYGYPQNMGAKINSSGRETFPYVSDKGTLFFASDGHKGLGGLDIFMVLPNKTDTDLEIYNLGEPVNSTEDDFTFIINETYQMGYFASNRAGGKGGDDIYGCKLLIPLLEYRDRVPRIKRKIERHMKLSPKKEVITSF